MKFAGVERPPCVRACVKRAGGARPNHLMNRRLTIACSMIPAVLSRIREVMAAIQGVDCRWIDTDALKDLTARREADIAVCAADELLYPLQEDLTLAALIHEIPSFPKKLAVMCRADRADLRGLFFSLDVRNSYGKVWLVGAGPGSADLITLRAQLALAKADVVYYDDLVDESLLSFSEGVRVYVGKRKGRVSHAQDAINDALYRSAVEGKTVVRLKGGDPSIFGRAGEEVDYLRRRWVRVEMIPGVTSASAASAAGLFSLTQRRISKSVTLLSAHGIEGLETIPSAEGTRVYYMAASKLKEIARDLSQRGVSLDTPVVLVRNAGFWDESCVAGTVENMADLEVSPPALLIAGNVTAFARVERKALFIGVDPDIAGVQEPVVHQPLIEAVSMPTPAPDRPETPLYRTVDPRPAPLDLSYFSAVIFSSPCAVEAFEEVYRSFPDHLLCYAFDDSTRDALQKKEVHPWRIVACPVRKPESAKSKKTSVTQSVPNSG